MSRLRLIMRDSRIEIGVMNQEVPSQEVPMPNFRGYGHCSDHVGQTIWVAAVTKPKPPPDQLEDLLRWLLANMAALVPVPAPVQEVPTVAKLRQRLVSEIQSRQPAAVTKPKPPLDQLEDQLRRLLSNKAAPVPVPAPVRLVPTVNKLLQRLVAETQSRQPVAGRSPEPVGFGSYLSGQQTSGPQIRRIPVRRTQSRQPAAVSSPEPVRFGSFLNFLKLCIFDIMKYYWMLWRNF